ncbi:hypothetical protein SPRG_01643 [Saprolegnia parasitica CBS 223.65]|uniref:RING-type domain-containing protein n=1 Tax=Saprolegnia parasitica (strain CBS 223.65) TaxID=695850 RepID=A0A067D419_SAPPC|nr:hypothetical protein SPRG_01643 [Saprolegnia parasitica CBS 223.65]KDO33762.1 hypothetical protein SPRG_01643 [Saprolegnia parasitica CBS 223.65]|eukprot:XP_012195400.1 hypothetical protein SPRG_01643 [Saprolegnia parasitica CBS 223.65]
MKTTDDEFAAKCCVCGTAADDDSNILNTRMKILISKCGHRYCDQCVKREFQHHREITCAKPGCGKPIKKSQLQDKTKEEQDFAKDIAIRKKVLKTYNKTGEDFNTLDEYNAYLEEVEDLIFALLSDDEAEKEAAQKKWKQYKMENAILINANDAKKAEEERRVLHMIEEQQRVADERRRLQQKEDNKFQVDLERQKAQLMEVALGERDENDVDEILNPTTAVPIDQPLTAEMEAAMMGFQPGVFGGPQPIPVHGGKRGPGAADSRQLRAEQQRAGGYDPQAASIRNVDEAWCGAFFQLGVV